MGVCGVWCGVWGVGGGGGGHALSGYDHHYITHVTQTTNTSIDVLGTMKVFSAEG